MEKPEPPPLPMPAPPLPIPAKATDRRLTANTITIMVIKTVFMIYLSCSSFILSEGKDTFSNDKVSK
jgi:hypothetical protein